jgi:hypothetical protein
MTLDSITLEDYKVVAFSSVDLFFEKMEVIVLRS